MTEKVELGTPVSDSITGFTGVVTGRVEYITGCHQLLVQPPVKKDGELIEPRWFDEPRCVVAKKGGLGRRVRDALAGADRPGADRPAPRR
jgi:hypothetical protein